MPGQRTSAAATTPQQRRLLFEAWRQTGNVALACRSAGVARGTFYRWKSRFDGGGFAALETTRPSAPKHPRRTDPGVAQQVVALRRAHPRWGKQRIARQLVAAGGPPISANTVKRLLCDAGLWGAGATAPAAALMAAPGIKHALPQPPLRLVQRARLLEQLDGAITHRLTVISAGAGWGKTTLLSAWARRRSPPVAWLALDALDNHAPRFWSSVVAALHACAPSLGTATFSMLQSPEPASPAAVVGSLLAEVAALEVAAPIVLVLDDYHTIDDPAVHTGVGLLVEQLPEQLRVVLAGRSDPELPLSRWRVRGYLAELRGADLRFTVAEAREFFSLALDDGLAEEEVLQLEQRTEGWIAGLHLAAVALRRRVDRTGFVAAFTGGHRFLLDYVEDELVAQQPPRIRRFVLRIAVLQRMNAALCSAVTEEIDSQALLEWLERHNQFVLPLDEARQWYRLHELLRDVLLARLAATEPELLPQLHRRAAHWLAEHGELRDAITHAMSSRDFGYAAALLERAAPEFWLGGEAEALLRRIDELPDAVLLEYCRFALDAALRLVEAAHASVDTAFRAAQALVEHVVARVEALAERQPEAPAPLVRRRARLLRILLATRPILVRGDSEALGRLDREAEQLAAGEELRWKLVALTLRYWIVEAIQRRGGLMIDALCEAKQQAMNAGDRTLQLRVARMLTWAYARDGQAHAAYEEGLAALAVARQLGDHSASLGYFHLVLAGCYYGWNRLAEAIHELHEVLRIARAWQHADLLLNGYSVLALYELAHGDLPAAGRALEQAESLARREEFSSLMSWILAVRVRYWLAVGELEAARDWAEQAAFSPQAWDPNRNHEFLTLIRVYLVQGKYRKAAVELDSTAALLDWPGNAEATVQYLALKAVACHGSGQHEQARTALLRLLALTAPAGELRVYLDMGEPMRRLLAELHASLRRGAHTPVPVPAAYLRALLAAFGDDPRLTQQPARPSTDLPEPLTAREEEVLRLVRDGASNREIAARLVISLSTVKKHVGNVLAKLGVSSRSQAMAHTRNWPLGA